MEAHSIHITKENEKYDEVVHQREVLLRIKTLRRVELFSQLNDAELKGLAERLRYSPFARGNIITKQGDERSHWLYIIINGEAEVYVDLPNGKRRTVRILGRGNFFGEMGLLTGAPRSASVIAKTDVECYRIDKDVVEEMLHARVRVSPKRYRISWSHAAPNWTRRCRIWMQPVRIKICRSNATRYSRRSSASFRSVE